MSGLSKSRGNHVPLPESDNDGAGSATSSTSPADRSGDDASYSPRREKANNKAVDKGQTPHKRLNKISGMGSGQRKKVGSVARSRTNFKLADSRLVEHYHAETPCLISCQQRMVDCIQTCHVVPRAVSPNVVGFAVICHLLQSDISRAQVDKLEWAWGWKHKGWNGDTSSNLMHCTSASFSRLVMITNLLSSQ
jgi:hypothetical protein